MIRNLGAAAIFATFVPSYLVYAHLLPEGMLKPIAEFTKASNFLYLFIAAIIVGSIFGMDRQVLIKGFICVAQRRADLLRRRKLLRNPGALGLDIPQSPYHRIALDSGHGRRACVILMLAS